MLEILIPYTFEITFAIKLGDIATWVGGVGTLILALIATKNLKPEAPKLDISWQRGDLFSRAGDGVAKPVVVVNVVNTGKIPVKIEGISFRRKIGLRKYRFWHVTNWTQNATNILMDGALTDIRTENGQSLYRRTLSHLLSSGRYEEARNLTEEVMKQHPFPKTLEPHNKTEWLLEDEGEIKDLLDQEENIEVVVSSSTKTYYSK